jgi:hypothetical protein
VYITSAVNTTVTDSTFMSCRADRGGAISADDSPLIVTASSFVNNTAKETGGAVLHTCYRSACAMGVNYSLFANNSATQGGGIYWKETEPQLASLTFSNNSAIYGDDLGSLPSALYVLDADLKPAENLTLYEASSQLFGAPLLIGVFDVYGQLINSTFDDSLKLEVSSGKFAGSAYKEAVEGIFNFSNVRVIAPPLSTIRIEANWNTSKNSLDLSASVPVFLRSCIEGEYLSEDKCIVCPSGTYGLEVTLLKCEFCPSHASCPGGTQLVIKDNYWRVSELSDDIYPCLIDDVCNGGQVVTCSQGYSGRICTECETGYERFGLYNCHKCSSIVFLMLKIVLVTLAIWGVLAAVLYGFFTRENPLLLSIRSWFHYIQTVSLFTPFTVAWPEHVFKQYEAFYVVGTLSVTSLSSDCILDSFDYKPVYVKLVFLSLFPFAMICLSSLYWGVVACQQRSFKDYVRNNLALSLTLIVLISPYILQSSIGMFACRTMEDDVEWLVVDYTIKCDNRNHDMIKYGIALPSLIIWCLFTPIALGVWLYRLNPEEGRHLGLFRGGYQLSFKLWEMWVLFKKYSLVLLSTLLARYNPEAQLISGIIILHIHMTAQGALCPLSLKSLNILEFLSSLSAFASLSFGYLYSSGVGNNKVLSSFMISWIYVSISVYMVTFVLLLLHSYRPAIFDRLQTNKQVSLYSIDEDNMLVPTIRRILDKTLGATGVNPPTNSFADK